MNNSVTFGAAGSSCTCLTQYEVTSQKPLDGHDPGTEDMDIWIHVGMIPHLIIALNRDSLHPKGI